MFVVFNSLDVKYIYLAYFKAYLNIPGISKSFLNQTKTIHVLNTRIGSNLLQHFVSMNHHAI